MTLKNKIKRFTTISKVADILNTSQPNITQRLQRGSLTFTDFTKIADAIGCSVADLVADDNDSNSSATCQVRCPHCGKMINIGITAQPLGDDIPPSHPMIID